MPSRSNASKTQESEKKEEEVNVKEKESAGGKRSRAKADGNDEVGQTDGPPRKSAKTTSNSAIDWLLSQEAFDLANPPIPPGRGEIDWDASRPKRTPPPSSAGKTKASKGSGKKKDEKDVKPLEYSRDQFTPFQNLLAAAILSKPISHTLGRRTLQTLFNPPFSLRTLRELNDAGDEGRRNVLWVAKTQHKERSATLLANIVEGVKALCGAEEGDAVDNLVEVREGIRGKGPLEAQQVVESAITTIKGIGPMGASIFLRRIQGDWEEVFPYADEKSLAAAKELGLIKGKQSVQELAEMVGKDKRKFVRLLDNLVGIMLEKKMDEARRRIGG